MARHSIVVTRAAADALGVLGNQVRRARLAKGWTVAETAERLGVDHRTLRAAEDGSPKVAIGTVFNAAFMLGVDLFGLEPEALAEARRRGDETLALLPRRVRTVAEDESDGIDF